MARVWEYSQHSGTNLLMMLAIADFADDDGRAYPAVGTLAKKCRMSKRNAQDRLKELSDSGELSIFKNQGPPPKYPNLFKVNLDALGVKSTAPVQPTAPVQYSVKRGAAHCMAGMQPTAPKPSLNHQEPPILCRQASLNDQKNEAEKVSKQKRTPCPHKEIVALYREVLPTSPQIRDWTKTRSALLRARWNEDPDRQKLDYWERFFLYVAKSDFLTGRVSTPGRRPFVASLEWLLKPENFTKVREGRYHEEAAE